MQYRPPENILGKLTQSGALNVRNPMDAYMKAQKVRSNEQVIQGQNLNNEQRRMEFPLLAG